MSIFWDPRAKRPQIWVYPFFILLTMGLFALILGYGMKKAAERPETPAPQEKKGYAYE